MIPPHLLVQMYEVPAACRAEMTPFNHIIIIKQDFDLFNINGCNYLACSIHFWINTCYIFLFHYSGIFSREKEPMQLKRDDV